METVIFLDTHVVVWLYAGEVRRFSRVARKKLESQPLAISPMVLLEMQYLYEINRVTAEPLQVLKDLEKSVGLTTHSAGFDRIILSALGQRWTRDPFDRVIVAHADTASAPLLTKDRGILKHYSNAVWS